VCDSLFVPGCAGVAERQEVASLEESTGATLRLVDRFEAAPGRTISVYRRG